MFPLTNPDVIHCAKYTTKSYDKCHATQRPRQMAYAIMVAMGMQYLKPQAVYLRSQQDMPNIATATAHSRSQYRCRGSHLPSSGVLWRYLLKLDASVGANLSKRDKMPSCCHPRRNWHFFKRGTRSVFAENHCCVEERNSRTGVGKKRFLHFACFDPSRHTIEKQS